MVPKAAIENPAGAIAIAIEAGIQFFIIWLFYYFAKKFWKDKDKADKTIKEKKDFEDKIEPKL